MVTKKKIAIRKKTIKKTSPIGGSSKSEEDLLVIPLSKLITGIVVVLVILLVVFGAKTFLKPSTETTISSDTAVLINGEEITWSQLNAVYNRLTEEQRNVISPEAFLNQTVDQTLVKQEVEKSNIQVDEAELDNLLDRVSSQFSEEGFARRLEAQGLTLADFRQQLATSIQINELFAQNINELKITEEDLQQFFNTNIENLGTPDRVRASHILLNTSEDAEFVLSKVKAGEDFDELAKQYSVGPSAPLGGDLDFFAKGMLLPEFEEAAFNLNVGETSEVVQTTAGYHIIKVTDKRPTEEANYEELKPLIKFNLMDSKVRSFQGKIGDYIRQLRDSADMQIFERPE